MGSTSCGLWTWSWTSWLLVSRKIWSGGFIMLRDLDFLLLAYTLSLTRCYNNKITVPIGQQYTCEHISKFWACSETWLVVLDYWLNPCGSLAHATGTGLPVWYRGSLTLFLDLVFLSFGSSGLPATQTQKIRFHKVIHTLVQWVCEVFTFSERF